MNRNFENLTKSAWESVMIQIFLCMFSSFILISCNSKTNDDQKAVNKMIIKKIDYTGMLDISTAESLLESNAELQSIETINWSEYPYMPKVRFKIAHCQEHILLKYFVNEESVKAEVSRINGSVHKDSCVEFFISTQSDNSYYNFEFNCIGVPHVAYGDSRHDRQAINPEILKQIKTKSSLGNQPFEEKKGGHNWEMMILIPKQCLIKDEGLMFSGFKARANFYKCADETVKPHFVTWNPIGTEKPDYHQPQYFGEIMFE